MRACVEVHAPGLPPERFPIGLGTTLIGAGAQATFQPRGCERLGPEALLLEPDVNACTVTVPRSAPFRVAHAGTEHRRVRVPWGDDAFVLGIRFAFVLEARSAGSRSALVLFMALGLASAAVLSSLLREPDPTSTRVAAPSIAPLPVACGADPPVAADHGSYLEARARAANDRYPFRPGEGPKAVALLAEAERCYALAGDQRRAADVRERAGHWKRKIDADYTGLRIRLRLALAAGHWSEAATVADQLAALLADQPPNDYVAWLSSLRRELRRRAAAP